MSLTSIITFWREQRCVNIALLCTCSKIIIREMVVFLKVLYVMLHVMFYMLYLIAQT